MIVKAVDAKKTEHLFDDWQETVIWSCLQGVMGRLYANSLENPESVMAILGDFCYFAGKPNAELVSFKPQWCTQDFMIMVPQNAAWAELIESCMGERAKKTKRYAIKKEPGIFDKEKLQGIVDTLPQEYTLRMIDEELYRKCLDMEWSRDFVSNFRDYEMFRELALGAVVLKDGELAAGASSYSAYRGGIEVEIVTKESYRRRGLAAVCGAKLILECEKRGIYPSWDARTMWSVNLARKLGYHYSHEYDVYEIYGY